MSQTPDPVVSIVIPTYKHRDFVLQTLASVQAQTFTDYEIIVVNDGSPDDTADVLRPLVQNGTIRYFEQANAGQAAARNVGIGHAHGEFIALLDDDDLWLPDKLQWQVDEMRANTNASVVYGALQFVDDHNTPTTPRDDSGHPVTLPCTPEGGDGPAGNVHGAFVEKNWIQSPGQCLIRRSALNALGDKPFDPQIWGADDWDLWLRLAENGVYIYGSRVALRYRFHQNNASRNLVRMRENCLRLLAKHVRRNTNEPQRLRVFKEAQNWWLDQTRDHFCHLAWLDCGEGDKRAALEKLGLVARARPQFCLSRRYLALLWTALKVRKPHNARPAGA